MQRTDLELHGTPHHVAPGHRLPAPSQPWLMRPEFPVYVALKYQMCRQAVQRGGQVAQPRFTARRVLNLLLGPTGAHDPDRLFTDLYSVSSYFIRERLKSLNAGTVLTKLGKGLRNATVYHWNEDLRGGTLQSYQRLWQLVGPNIQYAFDAYRLAHTYGLGPFASQDFVQLLADRGARFAGRKPRRQSTVSPGVTRLLFRRLQVLERWGIVQRAGKDRWVLANPGVEIAHWLELFVYSVEVEDAPPMHGRAAGSPPGRVELPVP